MKRAIACAVLILSIPLAAGAVDKSITPPPDDPYATLKPGAGMEATRFHCASCHSTDYIVMQPRGDAKQWEGVVTKMMKVYGAQIGDQDVKTIVEYLASQYGPK